MTVSPDTLSEATAEGGCLRSRADTHMMQTPSSPIPNPDLREAMERLRQVAAEAGLQYVYGPDWHDSFREDLRLLLQSAEAREEAERERGSSCARDERLAAEGGPLPLPLISRLALFVDAALEAWAEGDDFDGSSIQDVAEDLDLLTKTTFNREVHEDAHGVGVEDGDDWFIPAADLSAAVRQAERARAAAPKAVVPSAAQENPQAHDALQSAERARESAKLLARFPRDLSDRQYEDVARDLNETADALQSALAAKEEAERRVSELETVAKKLLICRSTNHRADDFAFAVDREVVPLARSALSPKNAPEAPAK